MTSGAPPSPDGATTLDDVAPPGTAPTGSHAIAPATLAMIVVLLIIGATASWLRISGARTAARPDDVDLSAPHWAPSVTELAALADVTRARHEAAPDPKSAQVQQLIGAFVAFQSEDARTQGDRRSEALADARAEYEQRALSFLSFGGAEAFMGLGQKAVDRFMAALRDGDAEELRRWGGTFPNHLRATGLIDGKQQPASGGATHVIRAAYVSMWARAVITNRPVESLVSAEEVMLLDKWKIAANPLVRRERREEIARRMLDRDPSWPVLQALGARAASEGAWPAAARWYRMASDAEPHDLRLRANAEYAAARAGAGR